MPKRILSLIRQTGVVFRGREVFSVKTVRSTREGRIMIEDIRRGYPKRQERKQIGKVE